MQTIAPCNSLVFSFEGCFYWFFFLDTRLFLVSLFFEACFVFLFRFDLFGTSSLSIVRVVGPLDLLCLSFPGTQPLELFELQNMLLKCALHLAPLVHDRV